MAYLGDSIDAHLAEAAGNDPVLFHELRKAFVDSVERQIDLLGRSRCDANWQMAAMRLKGVAASFHATGLMYLAEEAVVAAPGDPVALRRIRAWLADIAHV